ncbi:MAG: O-antigen ligase family protein, partial [Bacteroidota bacterium]
MNSIVQTEQQLSLKDWLANQLIFQKLNNPLGYVVLMALSFVIAYLIAVFEMKVGFLILGAIVGIPILGLCMVNQIFSICVILTIGVLVEFFKRYVDAPFGTALDGLLFIAFFGVLIQQTRSRDLSFAKSPISVCILIWVGYNLLQVLNPWAASRMAWLYTVRSMAGLILIYFIACYALKSLKTISFLIKWILGLSFLSALYGLKQEFLGFTTTELNWLYSDPERLQLIFQWSRLRIFSFLSDPTTYGIYMAYMGTFCFIMATGPFSNFRRGILIFAGICMFMAMAYAGSRTPFVLVPFGFAVFTLLTLRKEVIIGMFCVFLLGCGAMMKSTSSAVLYRIQSAFIPSKSSDTMQVRFENQKMIQPLIHSHPIGVGLGSSGIWGKRFTPDSMLADFAHDSQYVRIAV